MPECDGYIPGVPCWVHTSQPDPEAAVAFYSGLFAWEFEDVMPPRSEGKYFTARIRGGDVAGVGSIPQGAPPAAMWNTYIWVESADETASKVLDAGGRVVREPSDVLERWPDGRLHRLRGGRILRLGGEAAQRGANHRRARSLNFDDLNTRDPEAAKSFYGSVFG